MSCLCLSANCGRYGSTLTRFTLICCGDFDVCVRRGVKSFRDSLSTLRSFKRNKIIEFLNINQLECMFRSPSYVIRTIPAVSSAISS